MQKTLLNILMGLGVVMLMVTPSLGQSLSISLDSASVAEGGTVTGTLQVDGITAYRGHAVRIQVDPASAVESAAVTAGDLSSGGDVGRTVSGIFFFQDTFTQSSPPFNQIETMPATLIGFSVTLAAGFTGDVTFNIIENAEDGIPANIARSLSVISAEGDANSANVGLDIEAADFPGGITNGTVTVGEGPGDTPTPTATEPAVTATPTPTEVPVTPTPTETPVVPAAGYIVMDGFGGFHPMGAAPSLTGNESYYPMFDVVQDFDILPDNSGIVLVDGWGANLVFSFVGETAQVIDRSVLPPFMPGMDDYYRAVKAKGDSLGYWIISEKGELYGVGSALAPGATDALLAALPADITEDPRQAALPLSPVYQTSPIGEGENYVVDFGVIADGTGVVFLTGWGDQVVFGDPSAAGIDVGAVTDAPYFGWDIARAIDIEPTGKGYMVLDGFGGIHPVAGARAAHDDNPDTPAPGDGFKSSHAYFGWDIAKKIAYTPAGTGLVMLDGFGGTHYDGTIVAPAPDDRVYFGFDIARDIEIYISASISPPSEF